MATTGQGRASARVRLDGTGAASVETGVSVLDHLLELLATYASFDVSLEVEPTSSADAEITSAARAFGESFAEPLRSQARGHGSAVMPADEALAQIVLEVSDRPVVYSNVDLSQSRVAGLADDLAARFLHEFAESARVAMHVRLIEGTDTQHVLEAIFKALGVALAQACRPRRVVGET